MDTAEVDDIDRRIIHALFVAPRASFSRLSDVLGPSEQTIARRYRRMYERRVARVVGQLDSQRLGRSDWAVRIRCAPGSTPAVATRLAEHPDTAWVQLTSGGTEIFCTVRSGHDERRTPPLLHQLSVGRQVVGLEAYCLLHLFAAEASPPAGLGGLTSSERDGLVDSERDAVTMERSPVALQDGDWPLVHALAEDGRATFRQLAERTHWHESTVRRRVEELTGSGVLLFDVDLDSEALGLRSRALLWMSVTPAELSRVGDNLASRREIPFVAATTGPTNLVAALTCADDRALYGYITDQLGSVEGLTHIEISPVLRSVKMHATTTPSRA